MPGSSPVSSAFPTLISGRLPACFRERDFSRWKFSRLQLFRYVQASKLACLPDRSYRCRFSRRAAEAFTSEQNVRRYLRTHRICSPPDYRQLAARGLSPREIHSIVDCSISASSAGSENSVSGLGVAQSSQFPTNTCAHSVLPGAGTASISAAS
jgi:hypothetical protein